VFRSSGVEAGSTARPVSDRSAAVADRRTVTERTRGGDSSSGGQATGIESLYPRRKSRQASATREPQVIGSLVVRTAQRRLSVRFVPSLRPTAHLTGDVVWRETAAANFGLVAETVGEATAD